jgi:hypothetical protein
LVGTFLLLTHCDQSGSRLKLRTRVTGWVFEKVTQNIAQVWSLRRKFRRRENLFQTTTLLRTAMLYQIPTQIQLSGVAYRWVQWYFVDIQFFECKVSERQIVDFVKNVIISNVKIVEHILSRCYKIVNVIKCRLYKM